MKNKIRVLVIAWHYYPQVGGVETVARTICKGLKNKVDYIEVLTSSNKESSEIIDGIKVTRTPHLLASKEISQTFEKYFLRKISSGKFNIVHAHNISYPFNPEKSLKIINVCNSLGVPIIEHSHNAQIKTPEKTKEIIHSEISRFIGVSNFVKRRLKRKGINENKIEVIYNPVDSKKFSLKNVKVKQLNNLKKEISPDNRKIIFFPGRVIRVSNMEIGKQKQFKMVVGALCTLKKRKIKFRLVFPSLKGQPNASLKDISKGNELIKKYLLSKGLKEEDYFILKKPLTPENMPLVYGVADIVCMPSLNETFGMVFAESMAMERPIIAARSGAAPEVVANNGFLIKPKNKKEIERILEKLILDNNLSKRFGKDARRRIIKLFSEKEVLKKIIRVYKREIKQTCFLVRHPETLRNENNKFTGWEKTKYSKKGRKQFLKILNFFKGNKKIIFSSDLPRAFNLAKSLSRENKSKLIVTPLLRERNFKATRPRDYFENKEEFEKRVNSFLKIKNIWNAIIISHAGVIELILNKLKNNFGNQVVSERDNIFLIESNKKQKILRKIKI